MSVHRASATVLALYSVVFSVSFDTLSNNQVLLPSLYTKMVAGRFCVLCLKLSSQMYVVGFDKHGDLVGIFVLHDNASVQAVEERKVTLGQWRNFLSPTTTA